MIPIFRLWDKLCKDLYDVMEGGWRGMWQRWLDGPKNEYSRFLDDAESLLGSDCLQGLRLPAPGI